MPTPGERRALVFIASVAALGVAVRGWREFHPADRDELAGNRSELARQIQAVDSAIGVSSSSRKQRSRVAPRSSDPAAERTPPRETESRATTRRGRQMNPPDTAPRDPRQAYWDRSAHFDSVRRALDTLERPQRTAKAYDGKATLSQQYRRGAGSVAPPVDLDIADLDAIAAVPLIGAELGRRIFVDRAENGPFGSIDELERVPGLTHAFARRLERFVTFSGTPRHGSAGERRPQSKNGRRPGGESRP